MLPISARGRAGLRNAANVAPAAPLRVVVKRRASGVWQEARLRGPSPGAGEGGSQKVRNEERMARVVAPENMRRAYEQVKRNGGAAGVDGMSVEAYAAHAARHWPGIATSV